MGRNWNLISFSSKSGRVDCVNKRAEMHVEVRDWLKLGGAIPGDAQQLYDEMIAVEVIPTLDGKYKIPPKDDMKAVLGRSPNDMDTLALTFAIPVVKKQKNDIQSTRTALDAARQYNPLVDRLSSPRQRKRM